MVGAPKLRPTQQTTHVLLVDDEPLIRMALAEDLRAAGFSVVEASSADEALDYLSTGAHVDAVLTDIQTPGALDGLDLARHCQHEYPALPVILISAGSEPQELQGARTFMRKPLGPRAAAEAINESLGLAPGHGQG
jgi:two-component system, response regulator PdtaR